MFSILSFILGLCLLVIIVGRIRSRPPSARKRQHTAEGKVVRFRCERAVRDMEGQAKMVRQYYYPIVEFTTRSGQVVVFQDQNRTPDSPRYSPGQSVRVRYDRKNPENAKVMAPLRA